MNQATYDNINRELKDIAADLDMPPEVLERVYLKPTPAKVAGRIYVGSGEDFCAFAWHGNEAESALAQCEE